MTWILLATLTFADTSEDTVSASELASDEGGVGCSSLGAGSIIACWIAACAVGFRKTLKIVLLTQNRKLSWCSLFLVNGLF